MVPFALGPWIGMAILASPLGPFTLMFPLKNIPGSMCDPSFCTTAGSACARATASLYTSACFIEPKRIMTIPKMKATNSRMRVRHPAGTNHFQLRDHQLWRCGIPGGGMFIGGVAMLGLLRELGVRSG